MGLRASADQSSLSRRSGPAPGLAVTLRAPTPACLSLWSVFVMPKASLFTIGFLLAAGAPPLLPLAVAQQSATGQPTASVPLTLQWSGASSCGNADEVEARVTRLLGPQPSGKDRLAVVGEVLPEPSGELRLRLRLGSTTEERERVVVAARCEELLDAAALVIALAIEPHLAVPTLTVPSEESLSPQQCPAPPEPARVIVMTPAAPCAAALAVSPPPLPVPPQRKSPPLSHQGLGLQVASPLGSLPGLPLSAGFGWRYLEGAWRFGLSGQLGRSQARRGESAGATFEQRLGRVEGCWLPGEDWTFGPCAALEAGQLEGSGFGVDNPAKRDSLWLSAAGGLMVGLRSGTSLLAFGLSAEVALTNPSFVLNGHTLFSPWAVGVRPAVTIDTLLW
jgi:hypothetical protein